MSKETEQLEREIETIKQIINGYLSKDPILQGFELDSIGLKPKGQIYESSTQFSQKSFDKSTDLLESNKRFFVKCCIDPSGIKYPYYGAGPCPNGDESCS